MSYLVFWLISGASLGWLTTVLIHNRRKDLAINMVVGIIGAVITGYLLVPLFHISRNTGEVFSLPALLISLLGAVSLLASVSLLRRQNDVKYSVIERHWELLRPKLRVRWNKLTDQDLAALESHPQQLKVTLQERYGCTEKEAEGQIQRFVQAILSG